jgi:hypothetical protein
MHEPTSYTPIAATADTSDPADRLLPAAAPAEPEGYRIMRLQRAVKKRPFLLQHAHGMPIRGREPAPRLRLDL